MSSSLPTYPLAQYLKQTEIRKQIRAQRRSLTTQQQRQAANNLARSLSRHPLFLKSNRIAFYWPNDGEIDPTDALAMAMALKKTCYLPVLYRGGVNRLLFGRVTQHTRFLPNRFGIPEPNIAAQEWLHAQSLDLLLAPLVAFDKTGNRIGMGGGFYDNSLKQLKHSRRWKRPSILGLAHEFQCVESITSNAWDIPLHGAVTNQQIYNFNL